MADGGPAPAPATWYLYLLRTARGTYYTGITTDVDRRLAEHQAGRTRAAKALRAQRPLHLAYQVEVGTRTLALRAERRVKRLGHADKRALVAAAPAPGALLALLGLAADTP